MIRRRYSYRSYRLYERDVRKQRQRMLGFGALVVAAAIAVLLLIHYRSAANTAGSLQAGSGSAQSASGQGIPTDAKALGIAAGGSLPELSPQALNTRMAGIAASGATWVRFDFDWSQIQPDNATAYNWAPYDSIVAAAGAQHLHVLGIIDFTPAWARLNGCGSKQCPPASPAAYGHFAAALAGRYASKGVHDWEIWNEPNSPQFWQPGANPKAYVSLLSAAYSALHAADSHAYVLTGGLSPQPDNATAMSPVHFLTELYTDGAKGHFDAVADHPYTFPLTPASKADDAWTQMAAASHSLRTVMIADGDANKKIWITEFGAPTGGPGPISTLANPNLAAQPYVVDQGLQAKILSDAMAAYRAYSWAGPFFYYSYEDAGTDQSTNENFFGLVTAAGTPKQAYAVFQQAAAALKR